MDVLEHILITIFKKHIIQTLAFYTFFKYAGVINTYLLYRTTLVYETSQSCYLTLLTISYFPISIEYLIFIYINESCLIL